MPSPKSTKPARKKAKKSSAKSAERPRRALVPQPHGGALLPGGTGAAGTGRPPSLIRERLQGSFADRIRVLEEIADGVPIEHAEIPFVAILPHVTCPTCETQMEAKDPSALFTVTIKGKVSAKAKDRTSAIDIMAKYSLGKQDEVTFKVDGDEQTKAFAEYVHAAIAKHAPKQLALIIAEVRTMMTSAQKS